MRDYSSQFLRNTGKGKKVRYKWRVLAALLVVGMGYLFFFHHKQVVSVQEKPEKKVVSKEIALPEHDSSEKFEFYRVLSQNKE